MTDLVLRVDTDAIHTLVDQETAFVVESLEIIEDHVIEGEEELADVAAMLGLVKEKLNALEKKRQAVVGPIKKEAKKIDDQCRPVRRKLEGLERSLKKLYSDFEMRKRAEQQRLLEEAAAEEEDEEIEEEAGEALAPVADLKPTKMEGVTTRTIVDKDAIEAAVANGVREIPGVRIYPVWRFEVVDTKQVPDDYKKTSVAVRAR